MVTTELQAVYRELIAEHVAMRAQIDASMKEFKKAFKRCRPEDEASLASKFRAILDALHAARAAAGPVAHEKLRGLDV
jgi:hypothetical protein